MMDNPNAKIIEAPDRWDDETPSFFEDAPQWMEDHMVAKEKKKFSFKKKTA